MDITIYFWCFSGFRNICAHENIFYTCNINRGSTPFYAFESLKDYLMETNYIYFALKLAFLINTFRTSDDRKIVHCNKVLKKMGFPADWDMKVMDKYKIKKEGQ